MIKLEEITQTEYNTIALDNGTTPTPKLDLQYFKVLQDGVFVAIRCGSEKNDISFGVQFIVLKEFTGHGGTIMKNVIRIILETKKLYTAVWTEDVYTMLKGAFEMDVKIQPNGYKVSISKSNLHLNQKNAGAGASIATNSLNRGKIQKNSKRLERQQLRQVANKEQKTRRQFSKEERDEARKERKERKERRVPKQNNPDGNSNGNSNGNPDGNPDGNPNRKNRPNKNK